MSLYNFSSQTDRKTTCGYDAPFLLFVTNLVTPMLNSMLHSFISSLYEQQGSFLLFSSFVTPPVIVSGLLMF